MTSSSLIMITSGGGGRSSVNSKFAFSAASSANCTQSGLVMLIGGGGVGIYVVRVSPPETQQKHRGKVSKAVQEGGPLHCTSLLDHKKETQLSA